MDSNQLFSFVLVAFVMIVVPGPDWAFVLAAGTRDRVVLIPVLGIMTGYIIMTATVAFGLGAIVTQVPIVLLILTIAGAGYLIYLGIRTLSNSSKTKVTADDNTAGKKPGGHFLRGMGVSALNPKALLVFVAILPQFVTAGGWPVSIQMLILGLIYIAISGVFYVPLGITAQRVLGSNPRFTIITTRVAGISMIVVGLALLTERLLSFSVA